MVPVVGVKGLEKSKDQLYKMGACRKFLPLLGSIVGISTGTKRAVTEWFIQAAQSS